MEYVRIPGKRTGLYRRSTLWLGDDHLLLVESSGYTEQYKRLYFKDIQAIIIRETSRKRDMNILFAATAFLAATPALNHPQILDSPLSFLGILFSVLSLIALLVNMLKGATCACSVQMPLAIHEVPSLRRTKHVESLLDRLKPQIDRIQGRLSREDMKAGLYRLSLTRSNVVQIPNPYGQADPQPLSEMCCRLHYVAFGFLLLDVVLTWLTLHHNNLPLTILSTITGLILFILLVTAVVRQRRSPMPGVAKTLAWSSLIVLILYQLFCWTYVYAVFILAQQVEVFRDQWTLLSAISKLDRNDHPLLIKVMMGYATTALVMGFSALAALMTSQWPKRNLGAELTLGASSGFQQGR